MDKKKTYKEIIRDNKQNAFITKICRLEENNQYINIGKEEREHFCNNFYTKTNNTSCKNTSLGDFNIRKRRNILQQ